MKSCLDEKKIMRKPYLTLLLILTVAITRSQSLYFPPLTGPWDTISPATLGWCPDKIDPLLDYLEDKNLYFLTEKTQVSSIRIPIIFELDVIHVFPYAVSHYLVSLN